MGVLDFLFPKRCVRCKKVGEYICSDCFARMSFDTRLICLVCGKNSIDGLTHPKCQGMYTIDGAFCGVVYRDIIRKLLYQLKYQPYLTDLKEVLAELLYESLIQQQAFISALATKPTLIPIPLSKKRLRERGYNQATILAEGLAKKFDLQMQELVLREKETKPQYGLSKEERAENIRDAFEISSRLKNQNAKAIRHPKLDLRSSSGQSQIIRTAFLVDDILTTGSTLYEAAKVLKKHGFTKVWGVIFAREQ